MEIPLVSLSEPLNLDEEYLSRVIGKSLAGRKLPVRLNFQFHPGAPDEIPRMKSLLTRVIGAHGHREAIALRAGGGEGWVYIWPKEARIAVPSLPQFLLITGSSEPGAA